MFLCLVDEQVTWFKISVHDSTLVTVEDCQQHLPYDRLDMGDGQGFALCVEEFLHVQIEVFEDEINFIFTVHYVHKIYNAGMV